jgi:YegS/Rv2252/BmrU family lipid kinase
VIVNPHSGGGATGKRWRAVEARLREVLGSVEVEATRGPRDAGRLAREGVRAGVERLVVAGGDGTTSEVINGLLGADLAHHVDLGLLPLGTGGDFSRTLGIPRDLDGALECLVAGKPRRVDAGRIRFRGHDGEPTWSFFANLASVGISALVVKLVSESARPLGGTVAYLTATLRALARYRAPEVQVQVRLDGEDFYQGPLLLGAVANGRYFGGGMEIAPDARPDDGLFDVVLAENIPMGRLLSQLPLLYRGRLLEVKGIHHRRGRIVEFDAEPGAAGIEVDGEPLGGLPVRVELLPGALSVLGPAG